MNMFRKQGPRLSRRLTQFFGADAQQLPIKARAFSSIDLPNLQLAIEAVTRDQGGSLDTIGYLKSMAMFANSFRELLSDGGYDPAVVVRCSIDRSRQESAKSFLVWKTASF